MVYRRFYRRRFLNRRGHHAGAYALADVSLEHLFRTRERDREVAAGLTVADCGRVVTLDFDAYDRATARNALHKARVLKEVVDGFVEALERATDELGLTPTTGRSARTDE